MPRFVWVVLAICVCACATGGEDPGPPGDGGTGGGDDSGTRRDGGMRRDSGPTDCPSGQHACGAGCVDDMANDPMNGCAQSCGGDPCPVPEFGVAACTGDGMCTWDCMPPAVREGDTCVCAARTCMEAGAECGMIDDGCGTMIDCGGCTDGTCQPDNTCGCIPDPREPNERHTVAPDVGDLTDVPDSSTGITGINLHSAADVDWFVVDVSDNCCDGNPVVDVMLQNIPSASNYELGAYYVCNSGGDDSRCIAGTADASIGSGCISTNPGSSPEHVRIDTSCTGGTDETGRLFIRVTALTWETTCADYRLAVAVN